MRAFFYSLAQSYVVVWSFQSRHSASCTTREPCARYILCLSTPSISRFFYALPSSLSCHALDVDDCGASAVPAMCTPNLYRNYSYMSIFSALAYFSSLFSFAALFSQNDAAQKYVLYYDLYLAVFLIKY